MYSVLSRYGLYIMFRTLSRSLGRYSYYLIILAAIILILPSLIKSIKKKRLKARYNNSGITEIDHMTGEQFEYWLKCRFEKQGFKACTTPKSNDFGADLVLRRSGQESIVIQAKRYSGKIGIKAVQEVIGAKAYYHCQKAMVVTNSYFTPSAVKLAAESSVELWDRKAIIDQLIADKRHD